MDSTDFLSLGKHKIVESVKAGLPGNISKALNVLTVKDNVLFTWDFHSHCVLTLNIKAARENEQNNAVICQKLLPVHPPIFSPEKIVVNESDNLLVVAGPNGVLVFELPSRCPPYGSFNNNKELVYCKTHSLDERLFMCNDSVEVLQVKFHPGSVKDNHILTLTSDNTLRLYQIEDEAINLGVFSVGETPQAKMPCSRITFLGALGEIAVDFDFGLPEIDEEKKLEMQRVTDKIDVEANSEKSLVKIHDPLTNTDTIVAVHRPDKGGKMNDEKIKKRENYSNFNWPIYLLSGDFIITVVNIPLYEKLGFTISGPLPMMPSSMFQCDKRACSITCLNSSPQIICVASTNGEIIQGVVLPVDEEETTDNNKLLPLPKKQNNMDREIYFFEAVDIELGLTTTLSRQEESYTCPVFLHKDESRCDRYFATHSTGVHLVNIGCLEDLQKFGTGDDCPVSDVFSIPSTAEYLVCTKTSSNKSFNPVIGFSLYYNPNAIITLLANGSMLTLALVTAGIVPKLEKLTLESQPEIASPMKEMLKMPFDQYIHNLLKKADSHPIMKLAQSEERSLKECHELIQRTAQIIREKSKCHMTVKEEIEKRAKALETFKDYQIAELESMKREKQELQEKAESLAEKYEDIREKQEIILKRCAKLLMQISMKKEILSDSENEYLVQLSGMRKKLDKCDAAIDKLIVKKNYQETQMRNWKNQHQKKTFAISETHGNTIKNNLVVTSSRIEEMIKLIKTMKNQLQLN